MLGVAEKRLVTDNFDLVTIVAKMTSGKNYRALTPDEWDDLKGDLSKALVECAARWPAYCAENKYDPMAVHMFRPFALLRLKGAVIDALRKASPLNRREIGYVTYAGKFGPEEAAKYFSVKVSVIQEAVQRKINSTYVEDINDHGETPATERDGIWETMHRVLGQSPSVVIAYAGLVYVHNIPSAQAGRMLGIRPSDLSAFRNHVEYRIISAVLMQDTLIKA